MSARIETGHVGSFLVTDLDRCEHGRHKQDPCFSCPDGQSTGNLYLTNGQRIGTTLRGDPIVVVEVGHTVEAPVYHKIVGPGDSDLLSRYDYPYEGLGGT